ncbi:MAG: SDR family oxidoreductase [Bacteroidota bacterium]
MKNILITGGTGFIGSNLAAALLTQGYTVRILRRTSSDLRNIEALPIEHRIGDVRDVASLRSAMRGCDTVFHTAAMVSFWKPTRPLQYEINIGGTKNVVEACLKENVRRLVHTSSIAAIGHPANGMLADESTPFNWERVDNGYKNSKHMAEIEITKGVERGLDAVMVNPGVVIGPGDVHFNGGKIIRSVKKHQALFYIKGGMNIVFVADVVAGHISASLKGRRGERYILGGENLTHKQAFQITAQVAGGIVPRVRMPISLLKLAGKFFDLTGRIINKEPFVTSELFSGAGLYNWYSSEKARRELGYTITSFREAITRTYDWYSAHQLL